MPRGRLDARISSVVLRWSHERDWPPQFQRVGFARTEMTRVSGRDYPGGNQRPVACEWWRARSIDFGQI